jgi:hypothetical protein
MVLSCTLDPLISPSRLLMPVVLLLGVLTMHTIHPSTAFNLDQPARFSVVTTTDV